MALAGPKEVHGDGRFVLRRKDFVPAYLKAAEDGTLRRKAREAVALLGPPCRVCPRRCKEADRSKGAPGVCRVGRLAQVSSMGAHLGEEDVLRGWKGSGTVFFTGCSLRCAFCQNFDISQGGRGDEVDARELAGIMLRLARQGCHNVNFVTPSHVVPQIVEALVQAVEDGLSIPLVYNSGGYDSLESLAVMDGLVDVYMPDFKFWDEAACGRYLAAPDYPSAARRAAAEMHRQVGDLVVDEDGVALRGVLVRHLVMPGMADDTGQVMGWLAGLSKDIFVNIMDQYHPAGKVVNDSPHAAIGRCVSEGEMDAARAAAIKAGLWRFDERWRPDHVV
ncbi:MAG: radical SAM protein [Elusimicrobia bacterium]|nr:radical SAM protein [Elusimicrobiota bacterium]